jgi:hypothetical protein
MTDTTISQPIQTETLSIPTEGLKPVAGFLAALGRSFSTALQAYGRAAELTYCAPFQTPKSAAPQRHHRYCAAEELAGRDPNW